MKEIEINSLINLLMGRKNKGYVNVPDILLKRWADQYGKEKKKGEPNGQ